MHQLKMEAIAMRFIDYATYAIKTLLTLYGHSLLFFYVCQHDRQIYPKF